MRKKQYSLTITINAILCVFSDWDDTGSVYLMIRDFLWVLRKQSCAEDTFLFTLRADGAWETDSVVMETELILRDVCVLMGGFMGCFAVCVTWEIAGFGLLGSYGNLNLPDWLLVVLMFKRHLRDRHMHKHMIEFRSGRTNLRVCLAVKLEKGIKESYFIWTNRENI